MALDGTGAEDAGGACNASGNHFLAATWHSFRVQAHTSCACAVSILTLMMYAQPLTDDASSY